MESVEFLKSFVILFFIIKIMNEGFNLVVCETLNATLHRADEGEGHCGTNILSEFLILFGVVACVCFAHIVVNVVSINLHVLTDFYFDLNGA